MLFFFFFQAEDGIRYAQESRGLGDVYKRQAPRGSLPYPPECRRMIVYEPIPVVSAATPNEPPRCLLYTSDAADDLLCVDLGGRRIIKKKKNK